jgi:hypothetical protein
MTLPRFDEECPKCKDYLYWSINNSTLKITMKCYGCDFTEIRNIEGSILNEHER